MIIRSHGHAPELHSLAPHRPCKFLNTSSQYIDNEKRPVGLYRLVLPMHVAGMRGMQNMGFWSSSQDTSIAARSQDSQLDSHVLCSPVVNVDKDSYTYYFTKKCNHPRAMTAQAEFRVAKAAMQYILVFDI
jgi:hypothetical protein